MRPFSQRMAAALLFAATVCLMPVQASGQTQSGQDLQLPGQPSGKVVKLPANSTVLPDEKKCDRKKFGKVKKLTKFKIECYGTVEYKESTFLLVSNWLINEAKPGVYQLVEVTGDIAKPLGDISAVTPGFLQATQNSGNLEMLSIVVSGKYDSQTGWPYLRYRVSGGSMDLIPTRMFTAETNPINIRRQAYIKSSNEILQAEAARAAKREDRLATSQAYSTSFSRGGISLGHNLAPRGRVGCFQLPQLIAKLDRVVNEMEIYNNSNWLFKDGCKFVELEDPETYQKLGWYNNGKFFISIVFIRTEDGREFWKPIEVIKTNLAARNRCFNTYDQQSQRDVTIRLYGRDRSGLMQGCMNDYPFLGSEVG